MGSAGSKAAGRSYKAVQAGAQASAIAEHQLSGSVAVDAARAAKQAHRPSLTLEQEEQLESKDQALGSLLDQLGGAIKGKALQITPSQEQLNQQHVAVLADTRGRLPSDALKELLRLQAQANGGQLQAEHLLQKYKVDPQLVTQALSHVCLPELVEAEGPGGVKAFAEWPPWFQRRN